MTQLQQMSSAKRILIDEVRPTIDGGRYPLHRIQGEILRVEADVFRDGHDRIVVWLSWRNPGQTAWQRTSMNCANPGLDLWVGSFPLGDLGLVEYDLEAYLDLYGSWATDTRKKLEAGVDVGSDLLEGLDLARRYLAWTKGEARNRLEGAIVAARQAATDAARWAILGASELVQLLTDNPDPETCVRLAAPLRVRVDRRQARFAAWYECFPRSCGFTPNQGGSFADVIRRLPDIASMGFDVLYFPPIHPIGRTKRKGPNNSLTCGPEDPGCPYSIGSHEGGHDAIEPGLGTMADFQRLIEACRAHGLEIALDFAINCSPDHPYLKEHPEWFSHRPDGSIKFAENPPKKYEDIYPLNFDSPDWKGLWQEMRRIFLFWCERGVRIFRVDNPHTKPFSFWEWVIREIQEKYPDTLFLAEAFTRPKVMKALAKIGFTQSYTYFTWRNGKQELTEYFLELTSPPVSEYMTGNLFANTPDIFPPFLQHGGRAAYKIRAVLASTLSTVYGIFQGFELCDGVPIPGREEYLNSDKYEIRVRDWKLPGNIKEFVTLLNRARREHPALQRYEGVRFFRAENENILVYGKSAGKDHIIVVVNLDPTRMQHSFIDIPPETFGLPAGSTYQVHDLLTDRRFFWQGERNYVELDPGREPAHLLHVLS